jgi:hypothetical protein
MQIGTLGNLTDRRSRALRAYYRLATPDFFQITDRCILFREVS